MNKKKRVLCTGGAGYMGSVLVPFLIKKGYRVTVLDTFWYWKDETEYVMSLDFDDNPEDSLRIVKGDLRNPKDVKMALQDVDRVIHLACLSNDPSAEIDPILTHSINYSANIDFIDACKKSGVKLLIYASSSSVYGIKECDCTEDVFPEPLTQYSQLKVEVEHYLMHRVDKSFNAVAVRLSTLCGMSPRLRLDLVVNLLTKHAVCDDEITVYGGNQLRPLIHVRDMARFYELLLRTPRSKINGKIYNTGYGNLKVKEIAKLVKSVTKCPIIRTVKTNDPRSYHVNSEKAMKELGFTPIYTIKNAIEELKNVLPALNTDDNKYHNIKTMKKIIGGKKNG